MQISEKVKVLELNVVFSTNINIHISVIFFVKLDFEIAVDQQTKAHDQTFDGVPDSGFAIFKQLTSLKIIELNRVSIFFHEIFRINV